MVVLPLLGRLPAAGISASELEALIAQKIEVSTGRNEHVSVRMANRRPVYVVGLVNRQGSYPFATDMTVIHAVALGGGLYRPNEQSGGLVGVSRENARISTATLRLKQSLALHARLEAELNADESLAPPRRLVNLEGAVGAQELMARQTQIMERRNVVRKRQITSLKKTAELTKQQIKSLAEREQLIVKQIKLGQEELGAAKSLKQKGLMRRSDLFAVHRIIANLEADRRAVQSQIVSAKRTLLETEERIALFDTNEKLAIEQELTRAENDIATTENDIRSSQWIIGEMNNAMTAEQENANKVIAVEYYVMRTVGNKRQQFKADELTPLCPGDVIRVQPGRIQ